MKLEKLLQELKNTDYSPVVDSISDNIGAIDFIQNPKLVTRKFVCIDPTPSEPKSEVTLEIIDDTFIAKDVTTHATYTYFGVISEDFSTLSGVFSLQESKQFGSCLLIKTDYGYKGVNTGKGSGRDFFHASYEWHEIK